MVVAILAFITIVVRTIDFAVVEQKNFYDTVIGIFDLFVIQ